MTDIAQRLDRLPWSSFHWLVIAALGGSWILDGLEVTLVGSLSSVLTNSDTLGLSPAEIGLAASAYLAGAIIGAVTFGDFADRLGRKRLFVATVFIYAAGTIATGAAWNFYSFIVFRFVTGTGIGGEYAAINSAIQEFVPARCRGAVDIAVNGTFWAGAMLGAAGSMIALDSTLVPPWIGWRLAFAIGGFLATIIIALRRYIPESPRWLVAHGRLAEARATIAEIERRSTGTATLDAGDALQPEAAAPPRLSALRIALALIRTYPRRVLVGVALMGAQAFLYNAIFFTYAMILSRFYDVPDRDVGGYIFAFAAANLLGPLLLGRLFDSIGRKAMIAGTYALSGVMLAATAILFDLGALSTTTQTLAWMAVFFVASSAASAAYLTVGEVFPLECRALAIALFYAFGTALGGLAGPTLFGALIGSGSRLAITLGYLTGAVLMLVAACLEALFGISAERLPLEMTSSPLMTRAPGSLHRLDQPGPHGAGQT